MFPFIRLAVVYSTEINARVLKEPPPYAAHDPSAMATSSANSSPPHQPAAPGVASNAPPIPAAPPNARLSTTAFLPDGSHIGDEGIYDYAQLPAPGLLHKVCSIAQSSSMIAIVAWSIKVS